MEGAEERRSYFWTALRWVFYAALASAGVLLFLSVDPMASGLSELFIPALLLFVCFKLAEIAALLRKR